MLSDLFIWVTVATALLFLLELIAGRHRKVYNKGDFPLLIGSFFLGRWLMVPLSVGMKAWLLGFIATRYQGSLAGTPFWLAFPALLLVTEFCFYWVHRWAHNSSTGRFPMLWKIHRTHHSGKHMNVSLLFRLNLTWFFIIPIGWTSAVAVYLGLGEAALATILTIQIWNVITHSSFRWDDQIRKHRALGPLFRAAEHVFVSPGIHHTHHGYGKDGKHYQNFGLVLSLYDWIFGTLHIPEGRPSRYGLPGPSPHWSEELFYPFIGGFVRKKNATTLAVAAAAESQRAEL